MRGPEQVRLHRTGRLLRWQRLPARDGRCPRWHLRHGGCLRAPLACRWPCRRMAGGGVCRAYFPSRMCPLAFSLTVRRARQVWVPGLDQVLHRQAVPAGAPDLPLWLVPKREGLAESLRGGFSGHRGCAAGRLWQCSKLLPPPEPPTPSFPLTLPYLLTCAVHRPCLARLCIQRQLLHRRPVPEGNADCSPGQLPTGEPAC